MEQHANHFEIYEYKVAGVALSLSVPESVDVRKAIPNFLNFETSSDNTNNPEINIKLNLAGNRNNDDDYIKLTEEHFPWGILSLWECEDGYKITIQNKKEGFHWEMMSNKSFRQNELYARLEDLYTTPLLSCFMMFAFGQAALTSRISLFHASVVEGDGFGIAFLGKSGTGKSTHSALWTKTLEGFRLLNDDNPAIQVDDAGFIWIYGTPWSGKTPCYRNERVRLKAIVRLSRGASNNYKQQTGKQALISLLPSASALRWNRDLFGNMTTILEELVNRVQIGQLHCLPDHEAAEVCYKGVFNTEIGLI